MKSKICFALFTLIACAITAYGDDDGTVNVLYLKNNGEFAGHIWVNGEYQGYVSGTTAKYVVREGFVTRDSGVQSNGSVRNTYSYGGWEAKGPITVKIVSAGDGKEYVSTIKVSGDSGGKAYIWFGEEDAGKQPGELVWEDAQQIPSSRAKYTPERDAVSINGVAKTNGATDGDSLAGVYVWKGEFVTLTLELKENGSWKYREVSDGEERRTNEGTYTVGEPGPDTFDRLKCKKSIGLSFKDGRPVGMLDYYGDRVRGRGLYGWRANHENLLKAKAKAENDEP